jgi:hypothetical protein
VWGWVGAGAIVVIGAFIAHAGVIFHLRRIRKRLQVHPSRRSAHRLRRK